jgi:hypothetical protein
MTVSPKIKKVFVQCLETFFSLCQTTAAFKLLILESVTESIASMLPLLAMFRKLQDFVNFWEKLSK